MLYSAGLYDVIKSYDLWGRVGGYDCQGMLVLRPVAIAGYLFSGGGTGGTTLYIQYFQGAKMTWTLIITDMSQRPVNKPQQQQQ